MKPPRRLLAIIGALAFALVASLALNAYLYRLSWRLYAQHKGSRLDPIGLSHYSTEPEQQTLSADQRTVVFFGDSRAASWPAPELSGFHFVNRGIAAETSVQAFHRFDDHVRPLRPDVIIIQVGVNDLDSLSSFPDRREAIVANCQENIRQIVTRSTGLGARVILTTIFPTGSVPPEWLPFWSDDIPGAIKEVNAYIHTLEQEGVVILDCYALLADDDGRTRPEYSQDLLHLNAAGYRRLNAALAPLLLTLAAD